MKKVFVISLNGLADKFIVAEDQEEAFERRGEVDSSFEFLPVQVNELEIEGYDIHAKPKKVKDKPPENKEAN